MYWFCLLLLVTWLKYITAATTVENVDISTEPFKTAPVLANEQAEAMRSEVHQLPEKTSTMQEYQDQNKQEPFETIQAKCKYYFKIHQKEIERHDTDVKEPSTAAPNVEVLNSLNTQGVEINNLRRGPYPYPPNYENQQNYGNFPIYGYPQGYVNQPIYTSQSNYEIQSKPSPPFPIYSENQFNPRPTLTIPVIPTKPNVIKEEEVTTQNKYYQYVPYDYYPQHHVQQTTTQQYPPEFQNSNSLNNRFQLISEKNVHISSQNLPIYEQNQNFQNQDYKYIKATPLALQRYLVTDGKMLYYWYRSFPGYQMYIPVPQSEQNIQKLEDSAVQESNQVHNNLRLTYVPYAPEAAEVTTKPTTTSTTTEVLPFYKVTFTNKEVIPKEPTKEPLKFVYPVPQTVVPNKNPWEIDPYVYYSADYQPSQMNLPVRYIPAYPIVKTLEYPNKYVEKEDVNKVKIDDVNLN